VKRKDERERERERCMISDYIFDCTMTLLVMNAFLTPRSTAALPCCLDADLKHNS
jgi:hypothetical protein